VLREYDSERAGRGRRRRYDDDDFEPAFLKNETRPEIEPDDDTDDRPEVGDRWSTWDSSAAGERGPRPHPDWLVTELAAVDTELGVVKTGKEADVFLVSRGVPGTGRECLLAAKRYRTAEHRMFHRDAGYLEGRRVRASRVNRATANRTAFGREVIAGQWAAAEFAALCGLWEAGRQLGMPPVVPYPVQVLGTELLLEFIGDAGTGQAAPRLAQLRPEPDELADLWRQCVAAMELLARLGLAHGDLSPFNLLVHNGRLLLIDLPQVVDVVTNPRGPEYLARDVHNVATWFDARGLAGVDEQALTAELLREAGM
jgi:RIO kinase 1